MKMYTRNMTTFAKSGIDRIRACINFRMPNCIKSTLLTFNGVDGLERPKHSDNSEGF
jgi:hypothetical protein